MEKNLEKKSQKRFQLNCRKKLKNGTYKKIRPRNVRNAPIRGDIRTHSLALGVSLESS